MYGLDEALPDELGRSVEAGTSLLVSGPPLTGKRQLLLRLLARGARDGDGSLVVTTRESAGNVADEYASLVGEVEQPQWYIDCTGTDGGHADATNVRLVSSPGELTGMGIQFSEIAHEAADADVDRVRVGFDSLSPLLMYSDLQRVFRFLHVFTSQIQSRDWFGAFVIDPDTHEPREVNTLRQLFDGILELRETNDGTVELRVRGLGSDTTGWVALSGDD